MGAGLLSTRQSRLQAAHEVTAARLRIREHDERLLELRAEIAEHVSPGAVRELLERRGDEYDLIPVADRSRPLPKPAYSEAEFEPNGGIESRDPSENPAQDTGYGR